jgi:hypothetical protein
LTSAADPAVDLFTDDVGMPGVVPCLPEDRVNRPPESVLLAVVLHLHTAVAQTLDDLVANDPRRLIGSTGDDPSDRITNAAPLSDTPVSMFI